MTLEDLITSLKFGALKYYNFSDEDNGGIVKKDYPEIVAHLNLGLKVLYTKFPLYQDEIILEQDESITRYPLNNNYAVSNTESNATIKYLKDSDDHPFTDSFISVIDIRDSDGEKLSWNDYEDPDSLILPSAHVLKIPSPVTGKRITINYSRAHPEIVEKGEFTKTDQEIMIPIGLVDALELFIAYRALTNSVQPEMLEKSQVLKTRYNEAIMEAYDSGAYLANNVVNDKLDERYWA